MMKRGLVFLMIGLFVMPFLIGIVNAVDPPITPDPPATNTPSDVGGIVGLFNIQNENIAKWFRVYESGQGVTGGLLKYLFLLIVIFLAYSGFSAFNFPEKPSMQILLAIVIGILGTIMINPDELLTIMRSYTATGIAFSLILPIIALSAITFAAAMRSNAFGIVVQKILWAAYSVYLFVTAGGALLISWGTDKDSGVLTENWLIKIFEFFGAKKLTTGDDPLILTILFVSSIIAFVMMVLYNAGIVRYLEADIDRAREDKYKRETDLQSTKRRADARAVSGDKAKE